MDDRTPKQNQNVKKVWPYVTSLAHSESSAVVGQPEKTLALPRLAQSSSALDHVSMHSQFGHPDLPSPPSSSGQQYDQLSLTMVSESSIME